MSENSSEQNPNNPNFLESSSNAPVFTYIQAVSSPEEDKKEIDAPVEFFAEDIKASQLREMKKGINEERIKQTQEQEKNNIGQLFDLTVDERQMMDVIDSLNKQFQKQQEARMSTYQKQMRQRFPVFPATSSSRQQSFWSPELQLNQPVIPKPSTNIVSENPQLQKQDSLIKRFNQENIPALKNFTIEVYNDDDEGQHSGSESFDPIQKKRKKLRTHSFKFSMDSYDEQSRKKKEKLNKKKNIRKA